MATTLDVTSTRVLDLTETHSERLATIINTIATTEKMILMCGPGVSVACGMPVSVSRLSHNCLAILTYHRVEFSYG
jgi:hypothetical protein